MYSVSKPQILLVYSSAPPKTIPNRFDPNELLRFVSSLKEVENINDANAMGIAMIKAEAKSRKGYRNGSRLSNGKKYPRIKTRNNKP